MKNKKLNDKYTDQELAESFVFRNKLTPLQKQDSDLELNEMRQEIQKTITPQQKRLADLLQLKFQMEDYLENSTFDVKRTFVFFLREYLSIINKKNKDFASDIDIAATELSQILNQHRKPSEKIIIRLEIHSNELIPAIMWYKLIEKEKEHEILTDMNLRIKEKSHVRNILSIPT